MDSEERLELERELAAQLAVLHEPDDEEREEECALESQRSQDPFYVRLDLDQVLRECETSGDDEIAAVGGSTWALLLTNVQQCEADFFQPMKLELQELRDTILSSSSIEQDRSLCASSEPEKKTPSQDQKAELDEARKTAEPSIIMTRKPEEAVVSSPAEEQDRSLDDVISNASDDTPTDDPASEPSGHAIHAPAQSPRSTEAKGTATTHCIDDQEILSSVSQDALNEVRAQQMQLIQVQLEERQRWRRQIQKQQAREQEQAARWLQALEMEMQMQDQVHQQRARERLEALELRRMQQEEELVRLWLDHERESRERESLAREEQLSRALHERLEQQERQQSLERSRMAQEEALVWRLLKLEQERQRKQKLTEEKCTLRRLFMAVLTQLLQLHTARLVEQKRAEDAARKRELRANADMRREELTQRRVMTQLLAFEDEQRRQQARTCMALEDELAFRLRQLELERIAHDRQQMSQEDDRAFRYRQNLERELRLNREAMVQEDSLARLYQAQTERRRIGISTIARRRAHILKQGLLASSVDQWRRVVQCQHRAARCLQRFWRMQLAIMLEQCDDEEPESDDPAVIAAAMAVQSAFRGFSIRRKFANALEMAKLVAADDGEMFENVDLDELIALPPELADGWENPVLPIRMATRIHSSPGIQPPSNNHFESSVQAEEDEEDATSRSTEDNHGEHEQQEPQTKQIPEQNLAVSIWSRMRRAKRKTQNAALERVKQQDPAYRVQKLLHRVSATSTTAAAGNQMTHSLNEDKQQPATTVTWSTSNDSSKKKKKVKLPSLVDRLRKKTAAARDG